MLRRKSRHRFTWSERLHWTIFRLLEVLSEIRSPATRESDTLPLAKSPPESLWLFVSTIGELNAISPLTQRLIVDYPNLQLVLISDHEHYREPYLAKYPDAVFFHTRGASRSARQLRGQFPPRLLVIGEIPCFPSEAPCRFSYAFLREAKRSGAFIVLVNAWLYGEAPACLMDKLEHALLTRDYLAAIDLACVQTEEIRTTLEHAGMDPSKLQVTGNMKFDAVSSNGWTPEGRPSQHLLQDLIDNGRPIVVIGCLHNPVQQSMIMDAFNDVLSEIPDVLMIIAHRHPEVRKNLDKLVSELKSKDISYDYRSKLGDTGPDAETQCLILDTTGELKDFYAIATVTYVGADHNVLEPLSFGKPVTTVSAWRHGLPNYQIYELMKSSGAVIVADDKDQLSEVWIGWLAKPVSIEDQQKKINSILKKAAGATETTLSLVEDLAQTFKLTDYQ